MSTTIDTDTVIVTIDGLGDIEGKIDTGAGQTSLHADECVIDGNKVLFKLNDRIYQAELEDTQDISSADGGVRSRPCITLSIVIAGKAVSALVNLNDRGEMPEQLLIGQDVIKAAELTLTFNSDEDPVDSKVPENEELHVGDEYTDPDNQDSEIEELPSDDPDTEAKPDPFAERLTSIESKIERIIGILETMGGSKE